MPLHAQATWEQGFIRDIDGNGIATLHAQPAAFSGQIGANVNDAITVPVYGMSSVGVIPLGANVPTLVFEVSFDGGVNWVGQQMFQPSSLNVVNSSFGVLGFNTFGELPPGCTHFRTRVSIAGAANNTVLVVPSAATFRVNQVVTLSPGSSVALNASGARVGVVTSVAQGALTDETTTPLAGGGTFTGVIRDLTQISSGSFISSSTATLIEYRAQAMSDVAGTLAIEVSADQTTWWRIATQALAAVGSVFTGIIAHKPVTRYARPVLINGAGAQSAFLLSTARIGG